MMAPLVLADLDGPVAILTLNRPDRHNSLVPELLEELLGHVEQLASMPGLRAVLLRAHGRSFSTGGDLQGFADHLDRIQAYAAHLVGLLNRVILALLDLPAPMVAAVQGPVTGGSLGLVLAADIVLVSPEAAFTPYYSAVGFSPDGGWTALLPAVIGKRRAAEVLYCNHTIDARMAVNWGLASRLVPRGTLGEKALQVCRQISRGHPGSQIRTRALLRFDDLNTRLGSELDQFVAQIGEPDTQERMMSFLAGM